MRPMHGYTKRLALQWADAGSPVPLRRRRTRGKSLNGLQRVAAWKRFPEKGGGYVWSTLEGSRR